MAPSEDSAVRGQCHGVLVAGSNCDHGFSRQRAARVHSHRNRDTCIVRGSRAQHSEVNPPTVNAALRRQGTTYRVTRANRRHGFSIQHAAGVHRDRQADGGVRAGLAVSELPGGIPSPARHHPVRRKCEAVPPPGRDADDNLAGQHARGVHRDRHIAVVGGAVAQLAVGVPTPGIYFAVGREREGVKSAGDDIGDPLAGQHTVHVDGDRHVDGAHRAAITQCARVVGAPRIDPSVCRQRHRGRAAGGHLRDPLSRQDAIRPHRDRDIGEFKS